MSLAIVNSRALSGIDAPLINIEVHLTNGLPALSMVGLPEAAVRESKDRVRSAIINSNFEFPRRKITINLAPADLPKEGGRYDLAIALGILAASGQIPKNSLEPIEFLGELALSGKLRSVSGVLPASIACANAKRSLFVAQDNAQEAALPQQANILAADSLLSVCNHLFKKVDLSYQAKEITDQHTQNTQHNNLGENHRKDNTVDMSDVKGQARAKRALKIAAAGAHNLLFIGPPGTGKTMLATRLPSILPPLNEQETIQVASVYSIHPEQNMQRGWPVRPYRNPHHTASAVAMVGGGSHPKPGEVSLAHCGILFLDEFPEFDRKVLEVLREPLESGVIHIARAAKQVSFPANFQLIAAMNPCPCGYYGDNDSHCQCTLDQIQRYRAKLSGPLLDRIDLHVEVLRVKAKHFLYEAQIENDDKKNHNHEDREDSNSIRQCVTQARLLQFERQQQHNGQLTNKGIKKYCQLQSDALGLLMNANETLNFSPRTHHRILKVARTIADLDSSEKIQEQHMAEAISFRKLERIYR